jgi:hypothetical protein
MIDGGRLGARLDPQEFVRVDSAEFGKALERSPFFCDQSFQAIGDGGRKDAVGVRIDSRRALFHSINPII